MARCLELCYDHNCCSFNACLLKIDYRRAEGGSTHTHTHAHGHRLIAYEKERGRGRERGGEVASISSTVPLNRILCSSRTSFGNQLDHNSKLQMVAVEAVEAAAKSRSWSRCRERERQVKRGSWENSMANMLGK